MNRRGFLNLIGKASMGAYVAYSFPSIIVPKNIITIQEYKDSLISFAAMNRAYEKASLGNAEPEFIFLHPENYARIMELIKPQLRYTENTPLFGNGLNFRGATVIPSGYIDNKEIHTTGKIYGNLGRFVIGRDV